ILVTGGAGFIGSHLCERLLADGNEVIALDNYFTGDKRNVEHLFQNPMFRMVRHDITFPYFEEVDQIYNLACPSSPLYYMHDPVMTLKTSLIGAVNVLEVAKRMQARIVQASSSKVYGRVEVPLISEQYRGNVNPIGERSAYQEGKRAAESIFAAYRNQYGVDTRIVRLFNVYGPRMSLEGGKVIPSHATRFRAKHFDPRERHADPLFHYIDDAVEALVRTMNADGDMSRPVNVGAGRSGSTHWPRTSTRRAARRK
ncbi:MAG: NAD-dependent epimerase/dehydratase family protein, partial [Alistipes onderdonkii]